MLSFAYPLYLLLLLVIPAMAAIYLLARRARRKKLDRFGRPDVLRPLMPELSVYKPVIRLSLRLVALTALILAFARPWGGVTEQNTTREGIEVVAVVDASNSMLASATDDADGPSRITAAKLLLERMIDGMSNDRIGLVTFAAQAYSIIPVSSDFASAKSFLGTIDPNQMRLQGTNIADAINVANASFTKGKDVGKAIILFTDVEELDDEEAVMKAVQEAGHNGIQVDVVGVGTAGGNVINTASGVFTDDQGEIVHTRLNEDLGKKIAKAGSGIYVNAASTNALLLLQKQLREVKRTSLASSHLVLHDELFMYFAALALLCLVADCFMVNRKNTLLHRITFFTKEDKR